MPLYKDDAVVLRTWKLGETDRIIVLLTGQRLAKDYVGAADLVPYFMLVMLGIMSMY